MKIVKGIGIVVAFLIGLLAIYGALHERIAEFIGPNPPWYAHWWVIGPFVVISLIGGWLESRKG